ncbi:MAG: glutathione S-transferase family protein [Paracoccaceae bacterium]
MPKLYGMYRSRATRNLWLAAELGITLDLVPVTQAYRLPDPAAPDAPLNTRSPEFLAISPQGAIPVLQDGYLLLTESLAINFYLAEQAGGPLAPQDAAERAQMLQWSLFAATSIESASLATLRALEAGDTATADAQAATLRRPLATLDAHLAAHGHPVGGRFTLADIALAECIRYAQGHPVVGEYPAVQDWLLACQARPAFQQMWARRQAEPM